MTWFSNIPFLRLLVPFTIGILLAIRFEVYDLNFLLLLLTVFLPLAFFYYKNKGKKYKLVFLIVADLFLLIFAMGLVQLKNNKQSETYYGKYTGPDGSVQLLAVIDDIPIEKKQFIKLRLQVKGILTTAGFKSVQGKLIAYVRKSRLRSGLKASKCLYFSCRLLEIETPKNPDEFDYRRYLYNRQIYHSTFIDSTAYSFPEVPDQVNVIWKSALNCKQLIIEQLKTSGLTKEACAISSALLTGYDEEIDQSVMRSFSHSGTLHVLSVSGLHTGLIYLLLSFVFDLFDKHKRSKLLKFIFITVVLWGFAMLTGFSAPVLRAVVMFNLFGLGKIYFRQDYRNQLNILFVSAFGLLCYDPFFIADIGFLLSYSALFGLIYFEPKFSSLWEPGNKLLLMSWKSVTTSFAATLTTLPFTLFYFKQFPYWFFVANIIVIPASFVVLFLALLALFKIAWVISLINYLVSALIGFIHIFDSQRFGYLDHINFDGLDALWMCLLLILVSLAIQSRAYRYSYLSLVVVILWLSSNIVQRFYISHQNLFVVYDLKKQTARAIKNGENIYIQVSDSSQFDYKIKPHLISLNDPGRHISDFNAFRCRGFKAIVLDRRNYWPGSRDQDAQLLVLSNNFKLRSRDLKRYWNLETIVMDASNNKRNISEMQELCRKFGITFYDTHKQGAYLLPLNEIENRR